MRSWCRFKIPKPEDKYFTWEELVKADTDIMYMLELYKRHPELTKKDWERFIEYVEDGKI